MEKAEIVAYIADCDSKIKSLTAEVQEKDKLWQQSQKT
jgi:hypothetical protein